MAIYLGLPSPAASSDLPGSRRAALCFLLDLASDGVYTALPVARQAVVSYTAIPPLPEGGEPALRRFIFCCTFLGVASTRRYLASCPVKPGLSSPASFRYRSSGHLPYSVSLSYHRKRNLSTGSAGCISPRSTCSGRSPSPHRTDRRHGEAPARWR